MALNPFSNQYRPFYDKKNYEKHNWKLLVVLVAKKILAVKKNLVVKSFGYEIYWGLGVVAGSKVKSKTPFP